MGLTNMNRNRPIIITGKTGTGKTTMARGMLPDALVLYGDELEIDASSVNVENGLIIEDMDNNKKFFVNEKESVFIPVRTIHRIENFFKKPIKIMEAQLGSVLKESDIVRYKDIYGRIN